MKKYGFRPLDHKSRLGKPSQGHQKRNFKKRETRKESELVYGKNTVSAVLRSGKRNVFAALASHAQKEAMRLELNKCGFSDLELRGVEPGFLDSLCQNDSHRGWVLKCSPFPELDHAALKLKAPEMASCIVLDQVNDPGNFGAIIRSSVFFGHVNFVYTDRNSPAPNATVAGTSAGAMEQCRLFRVPNLANAIAVLKNSGLWVVGSKVGGKPIQQLPKFDRFAIVFGNERKGLRKHTEEVCDETFGITGSGRFDSLNVGASAAIAIHELSKR